MMAIGTWISYLFVPLGVGLGLRYARRFTARGWGLHTRLGLRDSLGLLVVITGVGSWIGLYFLLRWDPGVLWIFPEWVEVIHQDVVNSLFLCAGSFLCAAGFEVARSSSGSFAVIVRIFAMSLFGMYLFFMWSSTRPIAHSLDDVVVNGMVMQSSGSSCAAASAANVLRSLGNVYSEREMATWLRTTRGGTVPSRIGVVIRRLGFRAERFELRNVLEDAIPVPSILLVDHPAIGREGHAVSAMGMDEDRVEVWDSSDGKRIFTRAELARIWHGRGISVLRSD